MAQFWIPRTRRVVPALASRLTFQKVDLERHVLDGEFDDVTWYVSAAPILWSRFEISTTPATMGRSRVVRG